MTGRRLIDGYLEELRAELKLPRRIRARVLAEVADHLHEAAERREGSGDEAAQRAAIETFGSPRLVALRFSEELSLAQARRATTLTAMATVVFCAFIAIDVPWRAAALGRLYGLLSTFTLQIALTCAALSLIRAVRHRHHSAVPAGKLRWLLRGDAVALGCVISTAAAGVAAVLLSGHPSDHTGVLVRAAATIVFALPPLSALIRGRRRLRGLARVADLPPEAGDDALADVAALMQEVRGWATGRPGVGRAATTLERAARIPVIASTVRALSLRRHPWRAATALALLAGTAIGLGHGLSEGGLSGLSALPRAAAGFGILLAIEGAAVLACFAALGGYLGIRGSARGSGTTR